MKDEDVVKQIERNNFYINFFKNLKSMGANDGFTPDENIPPKDKWDNLNDAHRTMREKDVEARQNAVRDWRYKYPIPEKPLTHHQQAVKEFMVALVNAYESSAVAKEDWIKRAKETDMTVQVILAKAADLYADAFINQINKK